MIQQIKKNSMKKMIVSAAVVVCIMLLSFGFLWNSIENAKSQVREFQSLVGKSVIMKGDTLLIIDSSLLGQSYILENGKTISVGLANKLKKVK